MGKERDDGFIQDHIRFAKGVWQDLDTGVGGTSISRMFR